jgi:hypothetical protein
VLKLNIELVSFLNKNRRKKNNNVDKKKKANFNNTTKNNITTITTMTSTTTTTMTIQIITINGMLLFSTTRTCFFGIQKPTREIENCYSLPLRIFFNIALLFVFVPYHSLLSHYHHHCGIFFCHKILRKKYHKEKKVTLNKFNRMDILLNYENMRYEKRRQREFSIVQ